MVPSLVFGAVMVVVAHGFKGGRVAFQSGGVGQDVITGGDAVESHVGRACGGALDRREGNIPAVEVVKGRQHHGGAALLALGAVTGDMGRGDDTFFQQFKGNAGLIFPAVETHVTMPAQQSLIVGNGAARGVKDQAAVRQAVQETLITQMGHCPSRVMGVWKVMMSHRCCNCSRVK